MMKLNFNFPFFIVLLPVFFVLHGLNENYVPMLVNESFWLSLTYIGIAVMITGICWLLLRNLLKAALASFAIMAVQLFFGSAHDFLRANLAGSFLARYIFLLPLIFAGLVTWLTWLKLTKRRLSNVAIFLNILFIVLIGIDLAGLIPKVTRKESQLVNTIQEHLAPCDTCTKPDIYLVVADEYAGQSALKQLFGYDNNGFEQQLMGRGFHVINNPVSNYNATVYSMASLLNMDYTRNLESQTVNHRDMLRCRELIDRNQFVQFLKGYGYTIYNHSYFEMDGIKKLVHNPFYPTKRALFTAQTFTSRFRRNLGFHFASKQKLESIVKHHLYNNKTIENATRSAVLNHAGFPKFVYTHLAMPHHPYYYDSAGREAPFEKLTEDFKNDRKAYIEYLSFTNKKLISLIDHILANAATPPVIILLSDHGFRQLPDTADRKYFFMNFNAVLLPNRNYAGFYEGMSNVNELRVILNSVFGQRLPLLKDTTTFYEEPSLDF
jgi:hypothetical protein